MCSLVHPFGYPPGVLPPHLGVIQPNYLYVRHANDLINELGAMPPMSNAERFDWMSLKLGKRFGPNLLPEKTYKMIGKAILHAHTSNYLILQRVDSPLQGQVVLRIYYDGRNMSFLNSAEPGAESAGPGVQGNNGAGPAAQGNNGAGPGAQGAQGGRYRRSRRSRRTRRK